MGINQHPAASVTGGSSAMLKFRGLSSGACGQMGWDEGLRGWLWNNGLSPGDSLF